MSKIKLLYVMTLLTVSQMFGCSTLSDRQPNSYSSVPQELIDLLPAGKDQVTYMGQSDDGRKCKIELSNKMIYSADITIYNEAGQFDPKRSAGFQVGLGSQLIDFKKEGSGVAAMSFTKAGQQFSSDRRSYLVAKKNQQLEILKIRIDSQGFFGWSKEIEETCHVLK